MTDSAERPWLVAVAIGAMYAFAFMPATALAYLGLIWVGASERGWLTQAAAGALVIGWLALAIGAALAWHVVKTGERRRFSLLIPPGVLASAAYAIAYGWGGRMLI